MKQLKGELDEKSQIMNEIRRAEVKSDIILKLQPLILT